jgi:predicted hotdog family 3-hydroxylacyl-ACP dehydratase
MTTFDPENPTEQQLRQIDIHELLPQQEPFVMITTLVHFDRTLTVTETDIKAENVFVDNGRFSASGLMENIAQTCAARIGYVNKYILKKGIQLGFIGAVRGFEVLRLPKVGEAITTRVEVKEEVFGMTLADAVVKVGDEVLVRTEMKIAVRNGEPQTQDEES